MAVATQRRRSTAATRRTGYAVSIAVNLVFLYLVNVSPGWEAVPFLTPATSLVLGLVNASILTSVTANLVYLFDDRRPIRALGDLATTAVGLAAMLRIWQVFPLDFGDSSFNWDLVARILLGLGIFGSVVAIIVALVSLASSTPHRE